LSPPTSIPFPYTTLFRSGLLLVHAGGIEIADPLGERIGWIGLAMRVLLQDVVQQRLVALVDLVEAPRPPRAILRNRRLLQPAPRSEEHTSELQSLRHLVC